MILLRCSTAELWDNVLKLQATPSFLGAALHMKHGLLTATSWTQLWHRPEDVLVVVANGDATALIVHAHPCSCPLPPWNKLSLDSHDLWASFRCPLGLLCFLTVGTLLFFSNSLSCCITSTPMSSTATQTYTSATKPPFLHGASFPNPSQVQDATETHHGCLTLSNFKCNLIISLTDRILLYHFQVLRFPKWRHQLSKPETWASLTSVSLVR